MNHVDDGNIGARVLFLKSRRRREDRARVCIDGVVPVRLAVRLRPRVEPIREREEVAEGRGREHGIGPWKERAP